MWAYCPTCKARVIITKLRKIVDNEQRKIIESNCPRCNTLIVINTN